MGFKGLALFAVVLAVAQASVPVFGQATDAHGANLRTPPAAGSSTVQTQCNGGPCEDQRAPLVVTLPTPAPAPWSWHDRILWAACLVVAIETLTGIWLALSALKRIERLTMTAEGAAAAAAVSAQAALMNVQAMVDSERPWLLITVEPSLRVENSFTIMATNRGRTPATIVATAERVKIVIDETQLPTPPEYGEPGAPRAPIVLLPGESTPVKSFSREEGKGICETEESFKRVANWEEKAFIYGKIIYRDLIAPSDKQLHETAWCCWYIHGRNKSGLVIAGPPSYNSHT
ncbi:MAG: hypothetical protein ABR924_06375 [Terracidiphilus sp.]|jgi:hypothetical protein